MFDSFEPKYVEIQLGSKMLANYRKHAENKTMCSKIFINITTFLDTQKKKRHAQKYNNNPKIFKKF